MTTLAYRNGTIAADSRCTEDTEHGGTRVFNCEKIFVKEGVHLGKHGAEDVILATAGETFSGMIFVDAYGGSRMPQVQDALLTGEADFSILILRSDGLFVVDKWCRQVKVLDEFYAEGSGAKAAFGAMHMGASAQRAVEIACRIDPYTAPPIVTARIVNGKAKVSTVRPVEFGPRRSHARRKAAVGMPREGEARGPASAVLQHHGSDKAST